MDRHSDIAILGAGIIGLSIAVSIARRSSLKVTVFEKGRGIGEGSTGSSSAVCRFRYTHDYMVRLARDGIAAYRQWNEYLGIRSTCASYQRLGNIWFNAGQDLAGEDERLRTLGVNAEFIDDAELKRRYPALNTCRLPLDFQAAEPHACRSGGIHLLEHDAGFVEPVDALTDLLTAAKHHGVSVKFNSPVVGIERAGGVASGVRLADGSIHSCQSIVSAVGPWSARMLTSVGLGAVWPLKPTRIQIVQIERPKGLPGPLPVSADLTTGIYFRPSKSGQQIIVGSVLEEDEQETVDDPDDYARYADDDFIRQKLHALQHRLPELSYKGSIRGYSGLYTVNSSDVHPVVGPTPLQGFYVAAGFSGHGFKLAPAIGGMVARLLTGDTAPLDTDVSYKSIAYDRSPLEIAGKSVIA